MNTIEKIDNILKETKIISLKKKLYSLRPQFAKAAQRVLDNWEQDKEGYCEEYSYGGICQDIANALCDIMIRKKIECTTMAATIGEQHVWAIAVQCPNVRDIGRLPKDYDISECESYIVDISPYTYETGGGYTWQKIEGVKIYPNDIIIEEVRFEDIYEPSEWY